MSDWDIGDQCLLPAEMPAVSWAALSSAVGAATSGAQFPPSPAVASPWEPDDPATGGLPESCWFRSPNFYRSKVQPASPVFQLWEATCKARLPASKHQRNQQQLWWAGSVPTLSKKPCLQNHISLCPFTIVHPVIPARKPLADKAIANNYWIIS